MILAAPHDHQPILTDLLNRKEVCYTFVRFGKHRQGGVIKTQVS